MPPFSMRTLTYSSIVLLSMLGVVVGAERADESGKSVKIEVISSTLIPGKMLEAGSYIFRESGSDSGWNIIQVYNADQTSLISTALAYPNPKFRRAGDKVILMYQHGIDGSSRVMKGFFIEGDSFAQQWAYPDAIANQIGDANQERIPTTGTEDAYPSSLPKAAESWTPPITAAGAKADRNKKVLARTASGSTLPRTASATPLLVLIGILALLGLGILQLTRRSTVTSSG